MTAGAPLVRRAARSAPLAEGRLAVWESYHGAEASWEVFAQRLDPAGTPFLLCTACAGTQRAPTVAAAADGTLLAVWESEGTGSEGWEIRARFIDATGRALGEEIRLNSITVGDQTAPRVAAVDEAFVVVWQSTDPATGATSISARVLAI